ncbi:MAG: neutral/alkaline non-lysosomal ceramidase N-terminal domain-containing protein [Candidatus Aminicenantales bacterium]
MSKLRVGIGEIRITPPLGTDLAGFGFYLDRRATTVRDNLWARALYLQNEKNSLFLISLDLLSLSVELADKIRIMISDQYHLPLQNILLASTHTHSGPAGQPLPGLGRINKAYVRHLPQAVLRAASRAVKSRQPASFGFHLEAVEPIGYNRRLNNFQEIDPWLRVGIFNLRKKLLFLLNYACHPVTLGPTKEISADWPGAAVNALATFGHRALVLQGFCGDIDPVSYLNRRLGNRKADYVLCGEILANRALKSLRYITFSQKAELAACEERIRLPLSVFPREDLDRETEASLEANRQFPNASRVIKIWRRRIEKIYDEVVKNPWLENVPIQAMQIGGMRIIAFPGEPFCALGLKLRASWPALVTVGYANGDVGYLPTAEAYSSPGDYACYCAPKFYGTFNFSPEIESILLATANRLLGQLGSEKG